MAKIAAIIIVSNEEIHIDRCIKSLKSCVDEVHVFDSYSSDRTEIIAKENDAKFYTIIWENSYSKKFNASIKAVETKCEWLFRIDADEYVTKTLSDEINQCIRNNGVSHSFNAIYIPRVIKFMGKELYHGGMHPIHTLRLFKKGEGFCESRLMDEHIVMKKIYPKIFKGVLIDENLKGLNDWISKHNAYALKEALDIIRKETELDSNELLAPGRSSAFSIRKRRLRYAYYKLPLFFRPFIYFLYRYVFRLGLLDGVPGYCWHFFQAFWYRTLVDTFVYQIRNDLVDYDGSFQEYVFKNFDLDIEFKNMSDTD